MKLKEYAEKIKVELPAIFLALKHHDTPFLAKLIAALTVAYALSPIDLIPDFIPLIGYLDDLLIIPLLILLSIKLIPEEVMQKCRKESEELWKNGKPKKWYYAIPVVVVWILLLNQLYFAINNC